MLASPLAASALRLRCLVGAALLAVVCAWVLRESDGFANEGAFFGSPSVLSNGGGDAPRIDPYAASDATLTRLPPIDEEWNPPSHEPWFVPSIGPPGSPWQYQTPPGRANAMFAMPTAPPDGSPSWNVDFLARAYYVNDARIEYFGTEATFGAEGIVSPVIRRSCGEWDVEVVGEFYLNQPFDRNVLLDSPERVSHRANFDVMPFETSQLYLGARRGDTYFAAGKFVTPFGRYWDPLFTNNRHDAPFIRTESILWREIGLLAQWDPGNWVFTAALTNGGPDGDANSSKALVARAGYDGEWFSVGASIKEQDGIGSEGQKTFNNHVGLDAMVRYGGWRISGEVIRDEYGLRRPGLSLLDVTWGRSLYFRELNDGPWEPITGTGYYVNVAYDGPVVSGLLSFGEFSPEYVGEPRHDRITSRLLARVVYHLAPGSDLYAMFLHENDLENAYQVGRTRQGDEILFGWQFAM